MSTLSLSRHRTQQLTAKEQSMRDLSLDDYIHWMIDRGWYDVDPESGRIWNDRTGKTLKPCSSGPRRNYMIVGLVFSGRVVRSVRVHRMVAVKLWGVDAIRGKEVGHLDGNPGNNRSANLWLPSSNAEHDAFDNSSRGLIPAPRKTSWLPCSECGDPDGGTQHDCRTPIRISGKRFGLPGSLCKKCYHRLAERDRRASIRATQTK